MLSLLRPQTAAATDRISQAQEGASYPPSLVIICKDVALLWDTLCWEVYLKVHPDGHWEKGPGTPWESPEELWAVRYGGLGPGVHGSQLRTGQYVIP